MNVDPARERVLEVRACPSCGQVNTDPQAKSCTRTVHLAEPRAAYPPLVDAFLVFPTPENGASAEENPHDWPAP